MKNKSSYLFSIIALLLGVYFYYDFQLIGFPDGHLTEFEQITKKIYQFYTVIFFLFTLYFFYLGRKSKKNRKPKLTYIFFLVFIGLILIINYYLKTQLGNGGGG
jgi:membrane protease YdiL (CAAX protease family)